MTIAGKSVETVVDGRKISDGDVVKSLGSSETADENAAKDVVENADGNADRLKFSDGVETNVGDLKIFERDENVDSLEIFERVDENE